MLIMKHCIGGKKHTQLNREEELGTCNLFLHALSSNVSHVFLFVCFMFACEVPTEKGSPNHICWRCCCCCSGCCIFLTFLCKESVMIKRKSRDLSGSASLALWANMNQSTTQLGSRRPSQGKHLYATSTIFLCRAVNTSSTQGVFMSVLFKFHFFSFICFHWAGIIVCFPCF